MGIFTMPSLGADMEAGKLVEWMVKPGDTVKRGDVVAVVETQKGAIEIEIFEEGTVSELTAELGTELPVGRAARRVLKPGEAPPANRPEAAPAPEPTAAPKPAPVPEPEPATPRRTRPGAARRASPVAAPGAGPMASPAARVRAHELGIDLATLTGSGPGGVIVLGDVEATGTPTPTARGGPETEAHRLSDGEMRKAIAAAMTRAKQTIPHFYLSETIDVDPAIRFLEERNADRPPTERVLFGAVFVRAATIAASKVPVMNGHYRGGGYQPSDTVNPGVAVALAGGGLVAPALMDAAGHEPRRHHGGDARPRVPRPRGAAAQFRDDHGHDHRLQPRRHRGGGDDRRDLPAAGRADRPWRAASRPWVVGGRLSPAMS
jgi:pyruvate dehydrogenase E2 component (dihydrolipoamide acetyltransferase)